MEVNERKDDAINNEMRHPEGQQDKTTFNAEPQEVFRFPVGFACVMDTDYPSFPRNRPLF